jgi:hypothetical protein
LNRARCQRTTVSGWTRTSARFQPGQNSLNITQKNLSGAANRGCGCFRFKIASCCLSAKFSRSRSRRDRTARLRKTNKSLSVRGMRQL